VVEDNAELLEIVVTMIRDLGYNVLVAANGVEAIALLNGDTPIDLLFSDVVMPHGINGADLASEARSIDKNLKVLLTSGYPGTHGAEAAPEDFPILAKPYRRDDLARMLRAGASFTEMHALADSGRLRRYPVGGTSTPATLVIAAPLTQCRFFESKRLARRGGQYARRVDNMAIAFNAARWIERSGRGCPHRETLDFATGAGCGAIATAEWWWLSSASLCLYPSGQSLSSSGFQCCPKRLPCRYPFY
jgi:CheY-like chemotaxis protein